MKYQVEFKQIRNGSDPIHARWEVASEPVETKGMALAYAELTATRLGTPAIVRTVGEEGEVSKRLNCVIAYFGPEEHAVEPVWFEFQDGQFNYRCTADSDTVQKRLPSGRWTAFMSPERPTSFYTARSKALYGG
jgi:hypothetical protein